MSGPSLGPAADGALVDESRLIRADLSPGKRLAALALKWESLLFLIFVAMMAANSLLSPVFLDPANLLDATFNFTEKAIIALPMIFVILCGDMDISVASIISISSLFMGMSSASGAGTTAIVLVGLGVGLAAGLFNGLLITRLDIPAVAVTIGTMSLFRGVSNAVLGDQAYTRYPASFGELGQGYAVAGLVPWQLLVFAALAAAAALVLNRTVFGRYVYAIGNNKTAARFSGVPVQDVRLAVFAATGLLSGLAAVLLTSRIGSTRPDIASGWEMDVITSVVLGGVAITGGKGNVGGVIIATFLLGYLRFGMGVMNVPGKVMNIITGALLIVAILLPRAIETLRRRALLGGRA
ncbi:MAG TPA: ABC transporter permease [Spirochaetales bacterium]|nr:ABC transporter permease [Spirochaetales bacterium]HRY54275.1 ABC transporter permease [Spirochaetia bacterium]